MNQQKVRSLGSAAFELLLVMFLSCFTVAGKGAEAQLLPETTEAVTPTVVGYEEYNDPLEKLNRAIFSFNDFSYRNILIPLGNGYTTVVPDPVRKGVSGIFSNLKEPLHFINHGLQGEFSAAGSNLVRFLSNSTIGLLGIFDPAEHWLGIAENDTSLNATLTRYGVGSGPYLVMPLLGPADIRSGFSAVGEGYFHPVHALTDSPESTYILGFGYFQEFAATGDSYLELRNTSDDPYLYFRNQYLQGESRDEEFPANE